MALLMALSSSWKSSCPVVSANVSEFRPFTFSRHQLTNTSYTYQAMRVILLAPNIVESTTISTTPRQLSLCHIIVPATTDKPVSNRRLHSSSTSLHRKRYAVPSTILVKNAFIRFNTLRRSNDRLSTVRHVYHYHCYQKTPTLLGRSPPRQTYSAVRHFGAPTSADQVGSPQNMRRISAPGLVTPAMTNASTTVHPPQRS